MEQYRGHEGSVKRSRGSCRFFHEILPSSFRQAEDGFELHHGHERGERWIMTRQTKL